MHHPPTVGDEAILFSGRPSVCPSVVPPLTLFFPHDAISIYVLEGFQ